MGESLFNKFVDCRPATLLKRDSERGSYEICELFRTTFVLENR